MMKMFEGNRAYAALINYGWTEEEINVVLQNLATLMLDTQCRPDSLTIQFIHEFSDGIGTPQDLYSLIDTYIRHVFPERYQKYKAMPAEEKEWRILNAMTSNLHEFVKIYCRETDLTGELEAFKELKAFEEQQTSAPLAYVVGERYDEMRGREGVVVDVADDGINIIIGFNNPTTEEISSVKSNSPFELRLYDYKGVIFFLMKFGSMNWMDAPYNVHLSRNLTELMTPGEDGGYAIHIMFFDSRTGELKSNRMVSMSNAQSHLLYKLIQEQKGRPFSKMEHDMTIANIYGRMTTKQMLNGAYSQRTRIRGAA